MHKLINLLILLAVISVVFSGFESCANKKKKTRTIIKEKIDTVVVENTKEKEIVRVIYDTVFVQTGTAREEIKKEEKRVEEPLPSWNDTDTKKRIIEFVNSVTDRNSPSYVPPGSRIATFDQEGTLWPEKPIYFQIEFMFDRIEEMAQDHPEWKKNKLVKAALDRNVEKIQRFGAEGLFRLSTLTQANMSVAEYNKIILKWINTAKHQETGILYKKMAYKPMVELFSFLKKNGFKVYIVTESGLGFVSPWVEQVYGLPKEQVIGSRRRLRWDEQDGNHFLMRDPEILYINDRVNKVISIEQIIGKRPVLAFGNSDNDIFMLQWATEGKGKRLGGLIHHTDAAREWLYDKDSKIGHLEKGLQLAPKNNWLVVDMKKDWKVVYTE